MNVRPQGFVRAASGVIVRGMNDSNHVVVITGASSGIGRETALEFGNRGARVVAESGDTIVYQLCMPEDADVEKGMISTSSPIGRAILNKEEGDEINVTTPSGKKTFDLIKLTTIHDE